MEIKVDLFSDTGTRPSSEMRKFMAEAEVGDEQLLEDPSVNRLNKMTAELLGKEEAIYLPSGLMANQISFAVHCQPGEEIIMDRTAHPIHFEANAAAVISNVSIRPVPGEKGIFSADQMEAVIRDKDYHSPQTSLVSIEQTSNMGGGKIWPMPVIKEVCEKARAEGLSTHMDGARLLNAVVETEYTAADYAQYFNSVWIDLSKGLGAPVGSVLAGSHEFIEKARYWKQRLGGAMRQAGIIAAGGIYALENNVERLKEDNDNAKKLARSLKGIPGIELDPDSVDTNIVIFKLNSITAEKFSDMLLEKGVRMSIVGDNLMRAVTHLDVESKDIDYAVKVIEGLNI
ncbi:MAG: threonine aldolase family protein [Halanaerobiales bacterium]